VKALRWVKRLVILIVVLVVVALFGVPALLSSDWGRGRLEEGLSRALRRDVTIESISIGFLFQSVEAEGVRMAHPDDFPEGDTFAAGFVAFETSWSDLMEGRLRGYLRGKQVELNVLQRGDRTTLDGLGGDGEPSEGETPPLDISVLLTDCSVTYHDLVSDQKTQIVGLDVDVRLQSEKNSNRGKLHIRAPELRHGPLVVKNIEILARVDPEALTLHDLRGTIGGAGELSASAKFDLGATKNWSAKVSANSVAIDEALMPLVATLYPFASAAEGQFEGNLMASFDVTGSGMTWAAARPTIAGKGEIKLADLRLPEQSVAGQLASLAGGGADALSLNDTGAQFSIANEWLNFQRLSASGKEARYDMSGRVSMDGELDLTMDLLPLVKLFGGGAYEDARKYVDKLPVKIQGTTTKPRLRAPDAASLAGNALEKEARKRLGKLFGDK